MVTSSNNAESTGGSRDAFEANQGSNGSFGKKTSQALPSDPAKYNSFIDEDEHIVHKCDSLIGGGV